MGRYIVREAAVSRYVVFHKVDWWNLMRWSDQSSMNHRAPNQISKLVVPTAHHRVPTHNSNAVLSTVKPWWGSLESNPHGLTHMLLRHARLPFRHSHALSIVFPHVYL